MSRSVSASHAGSPANGLRDIIPAAVVGTTWARSLLAFLAIIALVALVHGPTANLTFYEEDPSDFGEAMGRSLPQLFGISTSALYYRPVHLAYFQLTSVPFDFDPRPAHLIRLGVHVGVAFLTYVVLERLWRQPLVSMMTAGLVAIHPMAVHGVARLTASQVPLTLGMMGTLALYLAYRLGKKSWAGWLAVLVFALTLLVQETAAAILPMALLLELYFIRTGRTTRMEWKPLAGFALALAGFLILWSQIEKTGTGFLEESFSLGGAVYLLQAAALPFARLLAALVASPSLILTTIVVVGGLGLLGAWYALRGRLLEFGLLLAFYVSVLVPTWAVKEFGYFIIGERTFYPALPWASALWAGLLREPAPDRTHLSLPRWLMPGLLSVVLGVSAFDAVSLVRLHLTGSNLMRQVIATQGRADPGDRLLLVNVPDRFHYERPPYPIGDWGMLVAPISMELSRYGQLRYGSAPETESLTAWELAAGDVARTPYFLITRGADTEPGERYEAARRADSVHMVIYHPDAFALRPVGAILSNELPSQEPVAAFGGVAELLDSGTGFVDGAPVFTLRWRLVGEATPDDTIFFHVSTPDFTPVQQADGDALGGLLPLTTWRQGDIIEDVRLIQGLPPGKYALVVGLYNRSTGERLPVTGGTGLEVFPGGVQVGEVTISS